MSINAAIRTPVECMQLLLDRTPNPSAEEICNYLVKCLQCAPGTVLWDFDGTLSWGHVADKNNDEIVAGEKC